MTDAENRLRAALKPFAELGAVLSKLSDNDDSVWTKIPDGNVVLSVAGIHGWDITAGQLRAAYAATADEEGEDATG